MIEPWNCSEKSFKCLFFPLINVQPGGLWRPLPSLQRSSVRRERSPCLPALSTFCLCLWQRCREDKAITQAKFWELLRSNLICLLRRFTERIKGTPIPVKCCEALWRKAGSAPRLASRNCHAGGWNSSVFSLTAKPSEQAFPVSSSAVLWLSTIG